MDPSQGSSCARILRPSRVSALGAPVQKGNRAKHYSIRTEDAYRAWVRRFIGFHRGGATPASGSARLVSFSLTSRYPGA